MASLRMGRRLRQGPTNKQIFLGVTGAFILLLVLPPLIRRAFKKHVDICPITFYDTILNIEVGALDGPVTVNCSAVIQSDALEISKAEHHRTCEANKKLDTNWYLSFTKSCDMFLHYRGYAKYPVISEEKDFPLAFSILTHEDVEQTERLLRAIYRPHNFYCIHVDQNSEDPFRQAMEAIAGCLDHVFLLENPVRVYRAEYTALEAELRCMEALLARSAVWQYFINLTGREFPLRTNLELVRILKAYDGANDIDGSTYGRPLSWTEYSWYSKDWRSNVLKSPVPEGFLIHKGASHVAASRRFVDYVVNNRSAFALRQWMRDIRAPEEHYFQSLNHNPLKGVPGAFTGDPDLKLFQTRFKICKSKFEECHGQWYNSICLFGAGDLPRVTKSRKMFASMFRSDLNRLPFDCIEHWYLERALKSRSTDFDVDFYRQQPWVKEHVR